MRRNGPVAIPSNSATVVSSLSLETTGQSESDIRTKRDAALTSFTSNVEAEQRSFETDVKEQEALQVGCRTQEAWRANGQQNANCEEVTCLRGLVALFENREDAIHAFQELRTTVPNGRYAASSTRWLTLLQGGQPASVRHEPLFMQLRQEILHGLLDPDTLAASRKLKEQERRIAEVSR